MVRRINDFFKLVGNMIYMIGGIAILFLGGWLVYFFRGKKVQNIDGKAMVDWAKIAKAKEEKDAAALKAEILKNTQN